MLSRVRQDLPLSSCYAGQVTVALIPAAGASVRLGTPKQLVEVNGERLVHRAARIALEAGCERVLLVEGAVPLERHIADLARVSLHPCADWARGPGASLRAGAIALGAVDTLVLLVDQHRVEAEHLRTLLAAPGEVAAAQYAGHLGVPARFAASATAALRALEDGAGAKAWLRANAARVTAVPMPEAEVDLDTPDQLRDLLGDSR
ncbi:MAG TPA: NTP transferase domain-containing protein [Archangium sp.]